MEKLLVFAAVLGVAYGGGRRLSESESRPILDGFETLCRSGQIGASGGLVDLDGEKTWVYCKRAGGKIVHENTQEKTFDVREPPPQAVFVNPPDISLKQRVRVTGTVKAPRTKIFYVPNKVDTTVDIDVQSQTERPNKPTVYFLNNGQDGSSSASSRSPSDKDDQSHESEVSLEAQKKLSRSDLLRLVSKSGGRAKLIPLPSSSSSSEDELDAAFSSPDEYVANSPKKREAGNPFTHAIRINEGEGQSRLLFLRKTN